ncbi:MAG: hypothetical protein ACE5JI_12285 [Acidobacteriota bacterium]
MIAASLALAIVSIPEAQLREITLTLEVRWEQQLSQAAREHLRTEVERILFCPNGSERIRLEWRAAGCEGLVLVTLMHRPARKVITGCSRGLHDHRLGFTQLSPPHVILWTEQVARAVTGAWGRARPPSVSDSLLGRALGRVLAHELGHLFLRLQTHRRTGLMRSSFAHGELTARGRDAFRLSDEDLQGIWEGIETLQARRGRTP